MALCALMATATLTSCEGALDDIFGEWSRPVQKKECPISFSISSKLWGSKDSKFTVEVTKNGDYTVTFSSSDPSIATVDPNTGEVTPVGAGTVDIIAKIVVDNEGIFESTTAKYTLTIEEGYQTLRWNETTKQMEAVVLDATAMSSTTGDLTLAAGSYIVSEDITITGNVKLSGDVNIILCDGKMLTINKGLQCGTDPSSPRHELNIYGQSENTGKLVVSYSIFFASPLNVYGGQIDITATGYALRQINGMNVYGGKVNAVINNSSSGGAGIQMSPGTTITIWGGEVTAQGPATDGHNGSASYGISAYGGNVVVNGGKLVAVGKKYSSNYSNGISGNLTVNGGSVEVKDVYYSSGEIDGSCEPAVSGTITLGTGVSMEGKRYDSDWADITDNSADPKKQHIRTKQ